MRIANAHMMRSINAADIVQTLSRRTCRRCFSKVTVPVTALSVGERKKILAL